MPTIICIELRGVAMQILCHLEISLQKMICHCRNVHINQLMPFGHHTIWYGIFNIVSQWPEPLNFVQKVLAFLSFSKTDIKCTTILTTSSFQAKKNTFARVTESYFNSLEWKKMSWFVDKFWNSGHITIHTCHRLVIKKERFDEFYCRIQLT